MAKDRKKQLAKMTGAKISTLKPGDDKSINIRAISNGFIVRKSGMIGNKWKEEEVYAPDQAGVDKIVMGK